VLPMLPSYEDWLPKINLICNIRKQNDIFFCPSVLSDTTPNNPVMGHTHPISRRESSEPDVG
jgi:hypothetical protein